MLKNEIENILKANDLNVLRSVLDIRPDYVQYRNEEKESLLAMAFDMKLSDEIIEYLIEELNLSIEDKNVDGISIFDKAVINGDTTWVKKFVEKGIDPNKSQRVSRFTPLMEAVTYNRLDIVQFLLEQDVDIYATDTSGYTAKDFARKMRKTKVLELFKRYERLGMI